MATSPRLVMVSLEDIFGVADQTASPGTHRPVSELGAQAARSLSKTWSGMRPAARRLAWKRPSQIELGGPARARCRSRFVP